MKFNFNKLFSPVLKTISVIIFALISSTAYAGYYVDYYSERVVCVSCAPERVVHHHHYYHPRHVVKKHKVHHVHRTYHPRSSYSISVYYPVSCESCYCRSTCSPCNNSPCHYRAKCNNPCGYKYYNNDSMSLDRSTADDIYPEYS